VNGLGAVQCAGRLHNDKAILLGSYPAKPTLSHTLKIARGYIYKIGVAQSREYGAR
jgi:hypothetical protein